MGDMDDLFGLPEESGSAATPRTRGRPIGAAVPAPAVTELGARLPAAIHLGTSSWSFPGWAGIVYDAPKLLADVRRMVREAKDKEGFEIRPVGRP